MEILGLNPYGMHISTSVTFPVSQGRRFKRISVFSRRRRRYICLQLSACLVLAGPTATLSSAFKLLPGGLPAGTSKSEFQRTERIIARRIDTSICMIAKNSASHLHPSLKAVGVVFPAREDKQNASQAEMKSAVREFGNNIVKGDVALFYYAGHVAQVSGENYLIPWTPSSPNRRRAEPPQDPFGFRASILLPSFTEIRRLFFRAGAFVGDAGHHEQEVGEAIEINQRVFVDRRLAGERDD